MKSMELLVNNSKEFKEAQKNSREFNRDRRNSEGFKKIQEHSNEIKVKSVKFYVNWLFYNFTIFRRIHIGII